MSGAEVFPLRFFHFVNILRIVPCTGFSVAVVLFFSIKKRIKLGKHQFFSHYKPYFSTFCYFVIKSISHFLQKKTIIFLPQKRPIWKETMMKRKRLRADNTILSRKTKVKTYLSQRFKMGTYILLCIFVPSFISYTIRLDIRSLELFFSHSQTTASVFLVRVLF